VGGKVYAIGGWTTTYSNDCRRYDPVTDTWEVIAPYPIALQYAAAVEINGTLYVYGGLSGTTGREEALYKYDSVTNAWSSVSYSQTNRPGPVYAHSTVTIDGKMYLFGGQTTGTTNALRVLTPVTNSWAAKAAAPVARRHHSAVAIDGKMYMFGGNMANNTAGTKTLYVYDPVTNIWTQKASAPTARYYHSAVVIAGKMYVFGGIDDVGVTPDTVDQYDPVTDVWTTVFTDSALAMYVQSAAVIADKAYIFGGIRSGSVSNALHEYTP